LSILLLPLLLQKPGPGMQLASRLHRSPQQQQQCQQQQHHKLPLQLPRFLMRSPNMVQPMGQQLPRV
jgi:hypothetical protein